MSLNGRTVFEKNGVQIAASAARHGGIGRGLQVRECGQARHVALRVRDQVEPGWLLSLAVVFVVCRRRRVHPPECIRNKAPGARIDRVQAQGVEVGMDVAVGLDFGGETGRREIDERRLVLRQPEHAGDIGDDPAGVLRIRRQRDAPEEAQVLREQERHGPVSGQQAGHVERRDPGEQGHVEAPRAVLLQCQRLTLPGPEQLGIGRIPEQPQGVRRRHDQRLVGAPRPLNGETNCVDQECVPLQALGAGLDERSEGGRVASHLRRQVRRPGDCLDEVPWGAAADRLEDGAALLDERAPQLPICEVGVGDRRQLRDVEQIGGVDRRAEGACALGIPQDELLERPEHPAQTDLAHEAAVEHDREVVEIALLPLPGRLLESVVLQRHRGGEPGVGEVRCRVALHAHGSGWLFRAQPELARQVLDHAPAGVSERAAARVEGRDPHLHGANSQLLEVDLHVHGDRRLPPRGGHRTGGQLHAQDLILGVLPDGRDHL